MNTTTQITKSAKARLISSVDCWSCGAPTDLDLCLDCATIDPVEVPDIHDPNWIGNTKPLEAIFEAPPSAKTVR